MTEKPGTFRRNLILPQVEIRNEGGCRDVTNKGKRRCLTNTENSYTLTAPSSHLYFFLRDYREQFCMRLSLDSYIRTSGCMV